MRARRSESVGALVVAAAALLFTCVFGFLSFMPNVDAELAGFLELAFFVGGVVTMGAFIMYFVMSRRSSPGASSSKVDRLLGQRTAALRAIPVGLLSVAIGVLWYLTRTLSSGGVPAPGHPASESFAAIDTAGIGAFLGFGSLYIILLTYVAVRAERAAIQAAMEESEVSYS